MSVSSIPISDRLFTQYYRTGWRGFYRLWRIFRTKNNHNFVAARSKYGAEFFLSPLDYIDSFVLLEGYYESEVFEAILPFLGSGAVLWDIGANFGLHSITAKYLRPETRVICFEPSPLMSARIHANARLNDLNVEIVSMALSDSPRFSDLYLADCNTGMTTLKPLENASYSGKLLCWCDTGDNLLMANTLPPPTVIKLDVEGSELDVLRGLKGVLRAPQLKALIFEAEPDLLNQTENEVLGILANTGFRLHVLTRHEKTHHHLENFVALRTLTARVETH